MFCDKPNILIMTYPERAKAILKDAIKSAIYIDENARSFYQTDLKGSNEEELSVSLYDNFKRNGISLEVCKYEDGMEGNTDSLNFFKDNRDLVILDWHLKGQSGEKESLQILNEIVKTKHIHFCSIYTTEPNLDTVLKYIVCYFSGIDQEKFSEIKESSEIFFDDTFDFSLFHQLNLNRSAKDSGKLIGEIYRSNQDELNQFKEEQGISDNKCAIIKASIVNLLPSPHLSDEVLDCPSFIDSNKNIIVINNTIITILKKSENKADDLLNNYFEHIINDVDSFNQLLGIELYNSLFRNSILTNDAIMSFSKDALIHHRKELKSENISHFFKSFMDEVLLEKIAVSLRDRDSKLLDDDLLDYFEEHLPEKPDNKELQKMNVFYNSLFLDKKNKILNFGDVFKIEGENKYLICITPLCDCLRPQDKTKGNFYFAEGNNIKLDTALKQGDTAFVSYLHDNIIIRWSEISTDNDLQKNKLNPVYIKPIQYKILEGQNIINDQNKLTIHYLNKEGNIKSKELNYLGTIRPNYAQRIANHAFSYPVRVGVDFVKI